MAGSVATCSKATRPSGSVTPRASPGTPSGGKAYRTTSSPDCRGSPPARTTRTWTTPSPEGRGPASGSPWAPAPEASRPPSQEQGRGRDPGHPSWLSVAPLRVRPHHGQHAHEEQPAPDPDPVDQGVAVDLECRRAVGLDLFYRLNVVALHLPPLRERPGDVELLASRLSASQARRLGLELRPLSPEAVEALRRHDWPGNVRELKNVLERALIAALGETIAAADLPLLGTSEGPKPARTDAAAGLSLEKRERQTILEALESTGGHRERAARLLGVSVRTLYNRLRQYGIH